MSTDHRLPCVNGDHCGEGAPHCPPEYPSDAQGPATPVSDGPVEIDLDAVESEIASFWGADRTTCRALVAEIRRLRDGAAQAWDQGFTRGFYDVLAGHGRDASESAAKNPYEATR